MINVIELYQSAVRDDVNKDENGELSYEMFNRLLKRAELNLLKYLTGDLVPSNDFPVPFNTQKQKDYLKNFIVKYPANNSFELPKDYYYYDNLYKLGTKVKSDCDTCEEEKKCNIPIVILDGQTFYSRCNSYIRGLAPTIKKPIAKIVNNKIETMPENLGSMVLEYIRYPKFGKINTVIDPIYNDVVADPNTSVNLEWGEWAIEPLIWFIKSMFATHTRERAAKENAQLDKPRG